jgi:hypothetical protein
VGDHHGGFGDFEISNKNGWRAIRKTQKRKAAK